METMDMRLKSSLPNIAFSYFTNISIGSNVYLSRASLLFANAYLVAHRGRQYEKNFTGWTYFFFSSFLLPLACLDGFWFWYFLLFLIQQIPSCVLLSLTPIHKKCFHNFKSSFGIASSQIVALLFAPCPQQLCHLWNIYTNTFPQ